MPRKNVLNSPRLLKLKKDRRKVLLRKSLLFFALFLGIIVGLFFLLRIEKLNINTVRAAGNKVVEAEQIQNLAQETISGNYLGLLPKRNILYYSKSDIETALREKFKRLKDINLSLASDQVLEVLVTERSASYTWCGDVWQGEAECYFLDDEGFVFDEAPYFSGEVYFKFFGSLRNFQRLILFKEAFESLDFDPVALYAQDGGDVKIFLSARNASGDKPEIIFKMDSDFQKMMENLNAALETEPLKSNFEDNFSSLEYIDLRFGNKVYYKFK